MANIPTSSKGQADLFDARPDRDWINPISMSQLQTAVKGGKKEVVLNGVKYAISYGHMTKFPASGETRESVRLKRMDGELVPMGYIALKKILDFDFETSD